MDTEASQKEEERSESPKKWKNSARTDSMRNNNIRIMKTPGGLTLPDFNPCDRASITKTAGY